MKTDEYWRDLLRCIFRIARSGQPVKLYLSRASHPTFIQGVGCIHVGTYTRQVSIQQLIDDIDEADRERRRAA